VIQADGGTRTAAITGAWIALRDAFAHLVKMGLVPRMPRLDPLAAVSVGVIDGEPRLDLNYDEDSRAETDMNIVATGSGHYVEIQGTAEGAPFDRQTFNQLLDLADKGIRELLAAQEQAARQPVGV